MKESCLHLFIYWTYLFGGTFAFFYRAMDKDSKTLGTNSVNQSTAPFDAFGQKMQKEIEKAKIKNKICGILKLCNQQPPKQIITRLKPPETSPSPNVPSPNINISLVFSEPSEHSNETTCMKFRLPEDSSSGKIVTGADVFVYIKNRKKRSLDKNGRKKRRRKRMRKISIKVSLLNEENHHKKLVSRLRFRPNPVKKWYKLVLPYSIIKEANKHKDRALNLCIECKRCNRNTQVILPLKTSRKRFKYIQTQKEKGKQISHNNKNKKMKSLRLRKNRPFLMCHTSEKTHQRRRRETIQCDKNNPYSQCCRHQEYIRFSDIGLGDRVTYPDGFYKTQCIGSCSSNSSQTDLALTRCTPSSYKPFKTVLVFDSDVMYLDIPQGNIQECACQ